MFGRFGVLGQVLRPVSQVQLLIDDGGLAQPLHRAPMHLGIDEPLRARDWLRDVLGDWPVEGQEAADEPASVGPVEGAGRTRPEMVFNVVVVELQSRLVRHARDHPDESQVGQAAFLVAAADVGMRSGKPDLLHALAILRIACHPCGRRKGPTRLVDGHRVQAVFDVVADLVVVEAACPGRELAGERAQAQSRWNAV